MWLPAAKMLRSAMSIICLMMVLKLVNPTEGKSCPEGYYGLNCDIKGTSLIEGPNGKEYFQLFEPHPNKENSRGLCQKAGGILPEPRNRDEYIALYRQFADLSFYLGMTLNAAEGNIVYDSDGTSVKLSDWGLTSPGDAANGKCLLHLKLSSLFADARCTYETETVVCERKHCVQGFSDIHAICYGLFREKKSWNDAKTSCKAKGGFLAEPQSAEEVNRVMNYAKDNGGKTPWIGGTFRQSAWVWADSGASVKYTDWYKGEPNNGLGNKFCLLLNEWSHWNDAPCDWQEQYICQM